MQLTYASLIAEDIDGLCAFYVAALAREELVAHRTPIFRAVPLDNGVVLALSGPEVYDLLGIAGWSPASGTTTFLTFGVDDRTAVESATARAIEHGATLLHPAYETSYGSYQSVLADPERNVFRFNAPLG